MKLTDEINEFTENVFNTVREPLLILDKDLRVVKANRSFIDYFKVSPEQTISTLVYELGNGQWDIPELKELLETILPEKTTFDNYEVKHDFAGIGNRILLLNARQIERVFGKEKIILLAIEDITERKHLEESLSETSRMTSEYLDILVNHAHFPIIIWDASFVITRFNNSFEKLSGYDISEVIGKKIDFLFPGNKRESTLKLLEDFLGEEKFEIIEIDILRKDKEIRTVLWNSANVFDKEGRIIIATIAQDINDRKRVEDALKESEEIFDHFMENSPYYVFFKDKNIRTIRLSANYELMLGKPLTSLLGKTMDELFPSELAKKMIEVDKEILNRRETVVVEEEFNGRYFTTIKFPIIINDEPRYLAGFTIDITENKQVEMKLQESEERFRSLYENSTIGLYRTTPEGKIILANPTLVKLLGFSSFEELAERDLDKDGFEPEYERKQFLEQIEMNGEVIGFESAWTSKKGKVIYLSESAKAIRDSNGKTLYYDGTVADITERKQAENELLSSKLFIEEIINTIPVRVFWKDRNLIYLGCNNLFAHDAGLSDPKEIIGKDDYQMGWRDQAELYRNDDRNVIESGESKILFEESQTTPEGKTITLLTSKIPLQNSEGEIIGILGTYLDITDRKLAEDQIRKLHRGVEHSPASVMITDINGNIEYVNIKFCDVTGYDYNEIIGKNPKILQSGEMLKSEYEEMWANILSGNDWQGEFHNKKKNGELYWESASISPIKNENGEVTHFIGIKEDITEKKKMNDELISSKEKAEEMSQLKSNFLANMSHELRTPLVGILGFADIICQEKVSPEVKVMAETICKSGNRLSETLNLILDLSQLESEKKELKFQKVELVDKTKEVITLFKETARKKGLLLKSSFSSESIFINFDERAYYSIMNNLINNAIKFTREGSVTTSVSQYDHTVEINVTDTGIGIAENDYQSIFDEFRQASEGYSRNFEGTGLGLSITKKLVEKYGGTIKVESEVGKGSTFKVILPVTNALEDLKAPSASEIPASKKSPEPKSVKPLCLLVDDDPFAFSVMKKYLEDYVELKTTVDAASAAELLRKKKYDIILMDINLKQGMDGKEAATMIRKMHGYEITPIIAITAYAMAGDKEEFISAGCSHYLSKPFSKAEIIDVVTAALKQQ